MEEKLLQLGLAGAIMGLVMYVVVKPLVTRIVQQSSDSQKALAEELTASRNERTTMCERHQQFHMQTIEVLTKLAASVDRIGNEGKQS